MNNLKESIQAAFIILSVSLIFWLAVILAVKILKTIWMFV